jgi:hypothetical protein
MYSTEKRGTRGGELSLAEDVNPAAAIKGKIRVHRVEKVFIQGDKCYLRAKVW